MILYGMMYSCKDIEFKYETFIEILYKYARLLSGYFNIMRI